MQKYRLHKVQFIWNECGGRHDNKAPTIGIRIYTRETNLTAIDPDILSVEEKAKALNAVNLFKQKRDGIIMGGTFADGIKQEIYSGKDESVASPTVSLK